VTTPSELLRTDLISWEIGPYYASLPGPMKLGLTLDGEVIVAAKVETGFLHRGLEKALELHEWSAAIIYADHLDPEAAIYGELALSLAVEEIAGVDVPPRATSIRMVLSELSRISSHLLCLVKVAQAVGAETLIHYVLRDRERVLDLFELLTGARFTLGFLRFGGVRADVTEGFIERVIDVCELIRVRIKEYNDLFTYNKTFVSRTTQVGEISPELIKRAGITGPNARASGVDFDVRKAHPYLNFGNQDFKVPLGRAGGGAHERLVLRLREVSESLEILKHVAETMPQGEYLNRKALVGLDQGYYQIQVPEGEAYTRVESARGLTGCHVVSDGSPYPCRVQFRSPSTAVLVTLPEILEGNKIEDLPVLLAGLDIGIAEADR
jgi:NADH:ubiquinone oxidoreductase subunit D